MNIDITYTDNLGEEVQATLPAHYVVCPRCQGHGSHLAGSLEGMAFTASEYAETFEDPEDRAQYARHGGIYDTQCQECQGKRVVLSVNEKECTTAEQKRIVSEYNDYLEEELSSQDVDRLTRDSERRAGC